MARRKVIYVEAPRNNTILLYGSLFLIILTFFVALSAISILDNKRTRLAMGSIAGSFGVLQGGRTPLTTDGTKNILPPRPPIEAGRMDLKSIQTSLVETGVVSGISVTGGKLGSTITIKSPILFAGQTDELTKDSKTVLDAIAKVIAAGDNRVIITGHTSSVPMEAAPYYSNWGLSGARALAVLSYFEAKGIKPDRLSVYGMGSTRPIASNTTDEGRRLNARVEITLVGELPEDIDLKGLRESRGEWLRSVFYKGFSFELEDK